MGQQNIEYYKHYSMINKSAEDSVIEKPKDHDEFSRYEVLVF